MSAHTVAYMPEIVVRDVVWSTRCTCGWTTASTDANAVYAAAMEHGEFA